MRIQIDTTHKSYYIKTKRTSFTRVGKRWVLTIGKFELFGNGLFNLSTYFIE